MEDMDRILGQQDRRSSDIFLCTPVLGQSRKRIKTNCNLDIETGRVCVIITFQLVVVLCCCPIILVKNHGQAQVL